MLINFKPGGKMEIAILAGGLAELTFSASSGATWRRLLRESARHCCESVVVAVAGLCAGESPAELVLCSNARAPCVPTCLESKNARGSFENQIQARTTGIRKRPTNNGAQSAGRFRPATPSGYSKGTWCALT